MTILFYLPFILYLMFFLFILTTGLSVDILMFILSSSLLLITAICFTNKKLKLFGIIPLSIYTIWFLINGYYDYIKWASSVIALINLLYNLIILYIFKKH